MIKEDQKLNPDLFKEVIAKEPTRTGFGKGLVLAGGQNDQVVALSADLSESTRVNFFKEKYPARYFEVGVAEQNLATVASGLAHMSKIPFIASYAIFSPGRNWEQIRTTICYNNTNVKIAGSHAGLNVGPDGGSHQALEDIALARVLPRMNVVVPCDAIEAKKATLALAEIKGPCYLRLEREESPIITTEESPFIFGKANILWESENPRVTIIATGSLVYRALEVVQELEKEWIGSIVVNLHTIKPLDKETIIEVAKKTEKVITIEEHQIAGGMGSAVAECLAENYPVPIKFIGVTDQFGQSGQPEELYKNYGLDKETIIKTIKDFI